MATVKNLEIAIPAEQFNSSVRTDSMNQTRIWINDVECEPDDDDVVFIPSVKPGDYITIDTRSSSLYGTVVSVYGEVKIAVEADGRFESIRGGLSGLLNWRISNATYAIVTSSLHNEPVRWDIYVYTKAAANCADSGLGNNERDEIWRELLAICAKTAVIKPLPEGWGEPVRDDFDSDDEILGISALAALRNGH